MAIYETLILVTNIEVGTENPRISELRKLNSLFFWIHKTFEYTFKKVKFK